MQLTRYHGPIDCGPLQAGLPPGDRSSGIEVRTRTISADDALKVRPTSRRSIDDAAPRAFAARVPCLDRDDFDPHQGRLVADHFLQIGKGPGVHLPIPCPAKSLEPVPDAPQVLHRDRRTIPGGLRNDGFRDTMVFVTHPAPLPSRQPLQGPLCGPCASGLEPRPAGRKLLAYMHGLSARMESPSGSYGDVVDAPVNADSADRIRPLARLVLNDHVDEPLAAPVDEFGGDRFLAPERVALVLAENQRGTDPTLRGCQGDRFLLTSISEDALVVVDASWLELPDGSTPLLRCLDGPADAADGADGKVGGKIEPLTDIIVDEMLKLDFVRSLLTDGDLKNGVAGQSVLSNGIFEGVGDSGCWVHLADDRPLLHGEHYVTYDSKSQEERRFLPGLKSGASAPNNL